MLTYACIFLKVSYQIKFASKKDTEQAPTTVKFDMSLFAETIKKPLYGSSSTYIHTIHNFHTRAVIKPAT